MHTGPNNVCLELDPAAKSHVELLTLLVQLNRGLRRVNPHLFLARELLEIIQARLGLPDECPDDLENARQLAHMCANKATTMVLAQYLHTNPDMYNTIVTRAHEMAPA